MPEEKSHRQTRGLRWHGKVAATLSTNGRSRGARGPRAAFLPGRPAHPPTLWHTAGDPAARRSPLPQSRAQGTHGKTRERQFLTPSPGAAENSHNLETVH